MRAVLAAVGSRGDVVPFVALAERLVAAGHEAVLVTHRSLLPAFAQGVEMVGVDSDPSDLLTGPAARALRRGDVRGLNQTRRVFADYLRSAADPTRSALSKADVLVASTFAVAAVAAARDRGVPVVRAHLWPEPDGVDGPMPVLPNSWLLPRAVRRVARAVQRRGEPLLAGFDGWWSRGRLYIVPYGPEGFTTNDLGSLHAYSPLVVPQTEPAAPECAEGTDLPLTAVTGWWTARDGRLSAGTAALLEEPGPPWMYVGFGSMTPPRADGLIPLIEDVCRVRGLRAMAQLGACRDAEPRSRVRLIGYEPHDALLPHMAVAVHHGGAGTTGAVVRAGVPSVVVPHLADQYYWAHRLHALGIAPAGLPSALLRPRWLAAAALSALVARALDPRTARSAQALAARVRSEDGAQAAVRWLERVVPRAGGPA